jgi:hypothetical protein
MAFSHWHMWIVNPLSPDQLIHAEESWRRRKLRDWRCLVYEVPRKIERWKMIPTILGFTFLFFSWSPFWIIPSKQQYTIAFLGKASERNAAHSHPTSQDGPCANSLLLRSHAASCSESHQELRHFAGVAQILDFADDFLQTQFHCFIGIYWYNYVTLHF